MSYITSKKTFPVAMIGFSLTEKAIKDRRSVMFVYDEGDETFRPELTKVPSITHKGTERERIACRKTLASRFPHNFPFRQSLSHMESARFWPFRTTIGWRRESSVFRYLTDPSAEFPYAYQKALSLVLAFLVT